MHIMRERCGKRLKHPTSWRYTMLLCTHTSYISRAFKLCRYEKVSSALTGKNERASADEYVNELLCGESSQLRESENRNFMRENFNLRISRWSFASAMRESEKRILGKFNIIILFSLNKKNTRKVSPALTLETCEPWDLSSTLFDFTSEALPRKSSCIE